MQVNFYSFAKKENSTARPSGAAVSKTCVLKDESGVLSPVIKLDPGVGNPSSYNYAEIPTFGRYYYVREWSYYRGEWSAQLEVDVLASWKTAIGNSTQYVLRADDSTLWNKNIVDNKYPAEVPARSSWNQSDVNFWDDESIVLGVVGAEGTGQSPIRYRGAALYYILDLIESTGVFNWLLGTTHDCYMTSIGSFFSGVVDDTFKATYNPMQFILSARWFPISKLYVSSTSTKFYCGKVNLTLNGSDVYYSDISANPYYTKTITIDIPKHPNDFNDDRGLFLYNKPFSTYVLEAQPWGCMEIDPTLLAMYTKLRLKVEVDLITGDSLVYATAYTPGVDSEVQVGVYNAHIGSDIAIGQTSTNTLVNIVSTAGQVAANAAAENWFGAAGAAISGIGRFQQSYTSRGADGSMLAYHTGKPRLRLIYHYAAPEDHTRFGYPVCDQKQISTVANGYIQCATGAVSAAATSSELAQISSYLTSGFYYE